MAEPRSNDDIILLGLNPSAPQEAQALRRLGNHVTLITNGRVSDWVYLGGRGFNLSDGTQVESFLSHLGLPPARIALAASAIRGGGTSIKDELGQLAMTWARVEHGRAIPGRMVLSGEHVGGGMFWGKGALGTLRVSDIGALAAAFPRVANAIEDLHMSACNSAIEVLSWPKIFPRLKTIWAYARSCPGTFTGASKHLALWDRATRGRIKSVNRLVAKGTRKGDHVVVWSPLGGMVTGEVDTFEALRARLAAARQTFDDHFDGRAVVVDTGTGPLREYYDILQAMLRHADLPGAERSTIEKRRDVTIRLIFYDRYVKAAFAREYGKVIAAGYAALGLPVPDFARLSRKEAVASISAFEAKADTKEIDAAERLRPTLVEGLIQLNERYIPVNWL
jgi:hypothetical protein